MILTSVNQQMSLGGGWVLSHDQGKGHHTCSHLKFPSSCWGGGTPDYEGHLPANGQLAVGRKPTPKIDIACSIPDTMTSPLSDIVTSPAMTGSYWSLSLPFCKI